MQLQQGCMGESETVLAWIESRLQLLQHISIVRVQLHRIANYTCLSPDDLHRRSQVLPGHTGTQDVVSIDHALQECDERVQARFVVEGQLCLQQIGVALARHQMVIQHPLLQRCQWIDVLHVCRPTRHCGHDAIDRGLRQLHQCQQLRGNACAAGRYQVRRHLQFLAAAKRCGRCRQGGLSQQCPHIHAKTLLAQPFHQRHRQQGVPAELEEIIVAPDPLHPQHRLPDFGQLLLQRIGRRLIRLQVALRGIGPRQCVPIQLAVGRQRPRVHWHKSLGHQVLRQVHAQMPL